MVTFVLEIFTLLSPSFHAKDWPVCPDYSGYLILSPDRPGRALLPGGAAPGLHQDPSDGGQGHGLGPLQPGFLAGTASDRQPTGSPRFAAFPVPGAQKNPGGETTAGPADFGRNR